MTIKSKIKKIETKTGWTNEKNYLFIHIVRPCDLLNGEELGGKGFFQKDNFKGLVIINEKRGENWRMIDSLFDEGRRILTENGYHVL